MIARTARRLRSALVLVFAACGGESTGPESDPQAITYHDRTWGTITMMGVPGKVRLWVDSSVTPDQAWTLIAESGATVVEEIPNLGYYVAGVTPGREAANIDGWNADSRVNHAAPLGLCYPASGVVAIEPLVGEGYDHANKVSQIFIRHGVPVEMWVSLDVQHEYSEITAPTGVRPYEVSELLKALEKAITDNKGKPLLINISFAGAGNQRYSEIDFQESLPDNVVHTPKHPLPHLVPQVTQSFLEEILRVLSRIPEEDLKDKTLQLSAGRNDLDLGPILERLRNAPVDGVRWDDILSRHILLVSTHKIDGANHLGKSKYSPAGRDLAYVDNPEAKEGTSFAAPEATSILWEIAQRTGVSYEAALAAAKAAANQNPDHVLVLEEAILIVFLKLKGGTMSKIDLFWVDESILIADTLVQVSGIEMEYEVSGEDGYLQKGIVKTDAGMAQIPVPPGVYKSVWTPIVHPDGPPRVGGSGFQYTMRVRVVGTELSAEIMALKYSESVVPQWDWATSGALSITVSNYGNQVLGATTPPSPGRLLTYVVVQPNGGVTVGQAETDAAGQVVIQMPDGYRWLSTPSPKDAYTVTYVPVTVTLTDVLSSKSITGMVWWELL